MIKNIKDRIYEKFYDAKPYSRAEVFWFVMLILAGAGSFSRRNNLRALPKLIREAITINLSRKD